MKRDTVDGSDKAKQRDWCTSSFAMITPSLFATPVSLQNKRSSIHVVLINSRLFIIPPKLERRSIIS